MDHAAAVRQALFEHELLEQLKLALRRAIAWSIASVGLDRKRSTICFTAESFGRHLERLMAIEEDGGYMREIVERQPRLAKQADALFTQHTVFRQELTVLLHSVSRPDQLDECELNQLCAQCLRLLDQVDAHDKQEIDLFQEGLQSEEGAGD